MASVSAVIVSRNQQGLLRTSLSSLSRQVTAPGRIVVVDNDSSDGTVEMLGCEFPSVHVIRNTSNRGFGAATNQGLAVGDSRYVLVLNSDAECAPLAVQAMVGFLEQHPQVAVVGPKLLNSDGTVQPSCYSDTSLVKAAAMASGVYDVLPFRFLLRFKTGGLVRRFFDLGDYDRVGFPDWFRGAAMMFRRQALDQIGGFDERFFLYFEETDVFYRLREVGWKVAYNPDAAFFHHGLAGGLPLPNQVMARTYLQSYIRFYGKHHGPARTRRLRCILFVGLLVRAVGSLAGITLAVPGSRENFPVLGALLLWISTAGP